MMSYRAATLYCQLLKCSVQCRNGPAMFDQRQPVPLQFYDSYVNLNELSRISLAPLDELLSGDFSVLIHVGPAVIVYYFL